MAHCRDDTAPEQPPRREQLLADLRTLTSAIPDELHSEETSYAAGRLYDFIDYFAEE